MKRYKSTMLEHEDKFNNHYRKIKSSIELLDAHGKVIEEYKQFKDHQLSKNENTDAKLIKNKSIAQDDLSKAKEDLTVRIDELDKNLLESQDTAVRDKNEAKQS